jgi:uncharacterized protein YdbL (DUF1318 family)
MRRLRKNPVPRANASAFTKNKEIQMIRLKNIAAITIFTLMGVLIVSSTCFSAGIKERMRARVPEIKTLKGTGVIGENNMGYLETRGNHPEHNDLVTAENKDRKKVYSAIAKQQGADARTVGKRRAKQISDKANPGEWLQNKEGKWYQKK